MGIRTSQKHDSSLCRLMLLPAGLFPCKTGWFLLCNDRPPKYMETWELKICPLGLFFIKHGLVLPKPLSFPLFCTYQYHHYVINEFDMEEYTMVGLPPVGRQTCNLNWLWNALLNARNCKLKKTKKKLLFDSDNKQSQPFPFLIRGWPIMKEHLSAIKWSPICLTRLATM